MIKEWMIILAVVVAAVALIAFLVVQNLKDEKRVVHQMEGDYPKPEEHPSEDEHLD